MIRTPRLSPDLRLAAVVVALFSAGLGVAGCDPPPPEDLLLGPQPVAPFAVERTLAAGGTLAANEPLVVRFTQDIDPRSVGSRSIRVMHESSRRPIRIRAWAAGRELRVAPLPGRLFPPGEVLALRLDGAPSPRSVRSTTGEILARPFELKFHAGSRTRDLVGPRLVTASPENRRDDVAPGSSVELRFSEPLARGSIASGDAVTVRVDGQPVAARLALSGDGASIVVHPASPLPPDRRVEVRLHECLLDTAGNPLDAASARTIGFRTRATSLLELVEDFADSAKSDSRVTSCGWDDPETPGVLVAKSRAVFVAADSAEPRLDLGDDTSIHFQLLVPGTDMAGGLASGLRVEFASAVEGSRILSGTVEAGPTTLDARDPSFVANRGASALRIVAEIVDPLELETGVAARPYADIVFEDPLRLEPGRSVLLDVHLELTHGARVAALPDSGSLALVEGHGGVAPAASLLVSPSAPQARSLWYDTGVIYPGWRHSSVVRADADAGVVVLVEFQCAPGGLDDGPDVSRASPWEADLSRLPAYRFVRFRVRFDGTPESGIPARIDRIVLPYER